MTIYTILFTPSSGDLSRRFVHQVASAFVRISQELSLAAGRIGERAQHFHINRVIVLTTEDDAASVPAAVTK